MITEESLQRAVRTAAPVGIQLRVEIRQVAVLDNDPVPRPEMLVKELEYGTRGLLRMVSVLDDDQGPRRWN